MSIRDISPLKNPLITALDVDSRDECLRIAGLVEKFVGGFKLGPRLVVRYGADIIKEVSSIAPVFVDLKFLDIPNTMETSVRASFEAGASLVTVHAWAGMDALKRLSEVERELNGQRPFRILVVTVLTSFNKENMPPSISSNVSLLEQVVNLADFSYDCGLKGVVCSALESSLVRQRHNDGFIVTPGIRFPSEAVGDQKRVVDPCKAIENGASAIVVGRPIVEAADPAEQAERFYNAVMGK